MPAEPNGLLFSDLYQRICKRGINVENVEHSKAYDDKNRRKQYKS
jgi:hypothetical protein